MKKYFLPIMLALLTAFSSCEEQEGSLNPSTEINDQIDVKHDKNQKHFKAKLSGEQEVPFVNTKAKGQAIFKLDKDGETLHYKVIVSNIQNITMAHIHLAQPGFNGGVVVWLYPSAPPALLKPGRFNGILAQGSITSNNLVGALAGKTLEDLIANFNANNAYVNVHTSQFPGGEIRGQISRHKQ